MAFFSVIIPTFNSSTMLGLALESIICQTFADLEIWVIDGQSKDNTIAIIEEFRKRDNRINFISEPDKGIYDAMNKGVKLSNGKWLYFLGSDDVLYSNDILINIYKETEKTTAPVIYGNVKMNGATAWANDKEIYAGEFDLKKLLNQNICHQAIFHKKEVFQKVGLYNTRYKVCADWDFNLRCFSAFEFHYTSMIVASYCGDGVSGSAPDVAFMNDKPYNIFRYFTGKLYRNEFVPYRPSFRKMIFEKNKSLNLIDRGALLFFAVILQMQHPK
jgi:glycosyltransferase involved in cell wall biosynthesis